MNYPEQLLRLFDYDGWANREVLVSLQRASGDTPKSSSLLAHIVAAEWLWLDRLRAAPQRMAVWPDLSLEECEAHLVQLAAAWRRYLDELTPTALVQPVSYTNTKRERWNNAAHDILHHVVLHSAYHRGQIASDLRATGHEPAYTDFIHAVRHGLVP